MSRNDCCNSSMNNNIPFGCGCSAYPYPGVSPYGGVRPAGPQGPQGPQGLQGPQGPAGATGTRGLQGPMGPIGPQGVQGAAGTQGLRGPKGDTGATGSTGVQGPTGMAATIRVETTARVPFDDNPSVVNVGTPQDAVLRFAIPSGMPGATGVQGPTGPTGPKGATGPKSKPTYAQLNSIIASADLIKDVQTQVPLHYGGEFDNVTLAIGTIKVNETGYYTLSYSMRPFLILTPEYADLTFSLRVNGVDIPQTPNTVRATSGTHELSFYGSTIVKLEKDDIVDSAFKCNEDAKFFFSIDNTSSLFLYKIS